MKLYDWLKVIDTAGINCNIYIQTKNNHIDEEPVYCGSMYEIPYWLADFQLADYNDPEDKQPPIWFGHHIRKTANDENGTKGYNGFIITVKE